MENNQGTPVEKRAVIMCKECNGWKMGGVESRLCAECAEKHRNPFDNIDWNAFWKPTKGDDDD